MEKTPIKRGSNVARIHRSENKTQIRHQCPGKQRPRATFGVEEVFDAKASSNGWDRKDDTSDDTASEDTSDV